MWHSRDVGCTDMDEQDFCFMSSSTTEYRKYRFWSQGWDNGWLIMTELQLMVRGPNSMDYIPTRWP